MSKFKVILSVVILFLLAMALSGHFGKNNQTVIPQGAVGQGAIGPISTTNPQNTITVNGIGVALQIGPLVKMPEEGTLWTVIDVWTDVRPVKAIFIGSDGQMVAGDCVKWDMLLPNKRDVYKAILDPKYGILLSAPSSGQQNFLPVNGVFFPGSNEQPAPTFIPTQQATKPTSQGILPGSGATPVASSKQWTIPASWLPYVFGIPILVIILFLLVLRISNPEKKDKSSAKD